MGEHVSFEAGRVSDYRLVVTVGNPSAPDGQTRVEVSGTGRFEAEQVGGDAGTKASVLEARDAARRSEGAIRKEELERLFYQASLLPAERDFPNRRGIPDEAIVEYRFERADGAVMTARAWLRDAEKDPALGSVLRELRGLLKRFSDDRIYL